MIKKRRRLLQAMSLIPSCMCLIRSARQRYCWRAFLHYRDLRKASKTSCVQPHTQMLTLSFLSTTKT